MCASGCRPTPTSSPPTPDCVSREPSACTCIIWSVISTPPIRARSTPRSRRARRSIVTRPRRTRPISSSRSTRRSRGGASHRARGRWGRPARSPARQPVAPRVAGAGRYRGRGVQRKRPGAGRRGGDAPITIGGALGSFVTLVPVGGPARGIVTRALRYPLRNEDLAPGTTCGVSNELAAHTASVSLESGVLLVVQPFVAATPGGGQ